MRLGVIGLEAPPEAGGMQEHARGLLLHLPAEVEIQLFTRPGLGIARPGQTIADQLNDDYDHDLSVLQAAEVDAWLALNAGAAVYAAGLAAPVFFYVHGKDGLEPWYPLSRRPDLVGRLMNALKLPGRYRLFNRWRMRRIGEGLRRARHVFANSGFTRQAFIDAFGLATDAVSVVPPGIDERHLQPLAPRGEGPLRLLTVSRLTIAARRKNIEGVLEALALLGPAFEVAFEVVGSGDDLARLQALAGRLELGDKVRFLGRLSDEALRQAYQRADAFILTVKPDPTDVEGFGMVYAEAAGAGVPSIATRSGGVVDAVMDGRTGVLIDDPTPDAIAQAIRSFAAERARYSPADVQAFAASLTSRQTTARLWETLSAKL